jgi:hypothetical protein
LEVITNSKTKINMEIKLKTDQVISIGVNKLTSCFNCGYVLDYDWLDSGFETYFLQTKENSELIIERLKSIGFTEIKYKIK